jgi:hypothetical protein
MARKRKVGPATETQAETQTSSPASNGTAAGEGQPATAEAGAGQQATRPATKKEAVQLALAAGVNSPIEIVAYVKRTFDVDMTPEHVSTIKGNLKREKQAGAKKAGPGRKKKAQQPVEQPEHPARTKPTPAAAGLTAQDLILLAELAARAGGFERLRQFVDALGGLR